MGQSSRLAAPVLERRYHLGAEQLDGALHLLMRDLITLHDKQHLIGPGLPVTWAKVYLVVGGVSIWHWEV